MSGTHTSLDAAATDRKARLAKLASLKRKQPGVGNSDDTLDNKKAEDEGSSTTDAYISGRNYDKSTKGPKLGFEHAPNGSQETVESHSERLRIAVAEEAAKAEAESEKGIDLFKLQPKRPNWDLKRDLAEKMRIFDVKTQNAIAQLVRQRIEKEKEQAGMMHGAKPDDGTGASDIGLNGGALAEAVNLREMEEQEDERREREMEQDEM